jgi:tetratricopeptide (TPR) repeat protein
MTVADRWFYFPSAGLLGLIGVILSVVKLRFKNIKVICYTVATIIILLLSLRTMSRNTNWSDNLTLFSHDAKVQDNYEIENNIGSFLSIQQEYSRALIHTRKSVELYPYDINLSNLGFIYEQLHDYSQAEKYYTEAITTKNISTSHQKTVEYSYLRLSGIYLFHKKPEVAKKILVKALTDYPQDGTLWAFLSMSEYNLHQQPAALAAAGKAKVLFPSSSTNNLYKKIFNKKPVDFQNL